MQVVIDADVLYGGTTRALLLYLDHHDVIRVRWSALLIVETSRALVKTGRLTREAASRTVELMARAAPDADVPVHDVQRAFRRAWPGVRDAKDLHVAACAVVVHDQVEAGGAPAPVYLITKNTKDFAPRKLAAMGILQLHPDAFLHELCQRDGARVAAAFDAFREDMPERPEAGRVLQKLASDGQKKTAAAMEAVVLAGRVFL